MLRLLSPLFAHHAGQQQVYMLLLPHVVSHCFPYNAGQLLPRGAALGYIPAAPRCVYICYILLLRFLSPLLAHHAGQQIYSSRICIYILYKCMCVYIYTYTCICIYMCVYVYIHIHRQYTHTHTHTHTQTHTQHTYMYVYVYTYMHTYVTHTHTHAHTHTHTHTHT